MYNNKSMFKKLKDKILKIKPDLKDSSIENYTTNIKKLSEYLNIKKFTVKYLKDYETVIEFLENKSEFSLATKKNYATSILVVIKTDKTFNEETIEAYTKYHKKLANIQVESYYDNNMNAKEKDNWISIDEIVAKIASLKKVLDNKKTKLDSKNVIDLYQQYVILNLYTLSPPLRNDYAGEMLLLKSETEGGKGKKSGTDVNVNCNKIVLDKKELTLCDYKTSKTYGKKVIILSDDLIDILNSWLAIRKEHDIKSKYLLIKITNYDEYMSKNLLTKYLNKIFHPKKVSSTILRKVYLSEKYPVVNTYREMQKDAYAMGHDINTAKMVYSKKIE